MCNSCYIALWILKPILGNICYEKNLETKMDDLTRQST